MIEQNFEPKKSIREYVNEYELKFELMAMKYSSQLKRIRTLGLDKVIEEFNKDREKRIKKLNLTIQKDYVDLGDIGVDSITQNIAYIKNLDTPTNEEEITKLFIESKEKYIENIKERLADETILGIKRESVEAELEYAENLTLTDSHSKEHFGKMLMLIIRNLAVKPSFSGYTDNWKDEFFSNAIEKTLLYSHNFDENLLSKRTGKMSKAFAYITQICFNAFIAIINERKKELKIVKDVIPYESNIIENYTPYKNENLNENLIEEIQMKKEYKVNFEPATSDMGGDMDTLSDFVEWQMKFITKQNELIDNNKMLQSEIEITQKTTPQEDKGPDYIAYIRDLESKIEIPEFGAYIDTLEVTVPKNYMITTEERTSMFNNKPNLVNLSIVEKGRVKRQPIIEEVEEPDLVFTEADISEEW